MNEPRLRRQVISADGTALAVQEWGSASGPAILLVHAWSQSHAGWLYIADNPELAQHRVVTFDLRGHGESARPDTLDAYTDNQRWAEDVHAVIDTLELRDITLVGWSLGGVVALDYVAAFGTGRVQRLVLSAAGNTIGTARAGTHFGAATAHAPAALGEPLVPRLDALLRLQQALVYRDLPIEEFGLIYAQALVASPLARAGFFSRTVDHEATLRGLTLPILLAHGTADEIITQQAARDVLAYAQHAHLSLYDGAGHAPHFENPSRWTRELLAFIAEPT
jgi:non-heme chloroperoxidase